jgi:hypothetical protein
MAVGCLPVRARVAVSLSGRSIRSEYRFVQGRGGIPPDATNGHNGKFSFTRLQLRMWPDSVLSLSPPICPNPTQIYALLPSTASTARIYEFLFILLEAA